MKKNMGVLDKNIRLIIAAIIIILYYTNVISGTLAIILGIIGLVFVITTFVNFCPLYLPFNINTNKKKN